MRVRQSLGIVAVVFLVLLAGCSGLPIIGEEPEQTPVQNNSTDEIQYPYGWNESGIQPFATKSENPMLTEDSLTFKFERTIEIADSPGGDYTVQSQSQQIHRVSGIQERWHITVERQDSFSEYFYMNDVEYVRTAVLYENDSIRSQTFGSQSREFVRTNAYQVKGPELMVITTDWTNATETTHDGKDVIKYTAEGNEAALGGNPVYELGPESGLQDYDATLYVGQETGYIHELDITVEGNRADDSFRANFHFEFSNFSQTDVPAPEWASEMQNNSSATPQFNNSSILNNSTTQMSSPRILKLE